MKRSLRATRPLMALGLGLAAVVTLIGTPGCSSRQLAVPASGGTANGSHLPFDRVSDGGGISPTAGFNPEGVPAGTEFTIRLQVALSSEDARTGQSFDAVLDEPVMVAGKVMVPKGATVSGSVVTAMASRSLHQPGYLRLTLSSIVVNGRAVPLQTSSIFAKGASYGKREASAAVGQGAASESALDPADGTESSLIPSPPDVKFSTGRRFNFRLAQPLRLPG